MTTIHYLDAGEVGPKVARGTTATLLSVFDAAAIDGAVVSAALTLGRRDFEDAVTAAEADAPVVAESDTYISWLWRNRCDTLDACASLALDEAGRSRRTGDADMCGAVLFSTCEPCPMCASLAVWANLTAIAFGASIEETARLGKSGILVGAREIVQRSPAWVEVIGGVLAERCLDLHRQRGPGPRRPPARRAAADQKLRPRPNLPTTVDPSPSFSSRVASPNNK